jgi:hypothetical protein
MKFKSLTLTLFLISASLFADIEIPVTLSVDYHIINPLLLPDSVKNSINESFTRIKDDKPDPVRTIQYEGFLNRDSLRIECVSKHWPNGN